MENIMPAKWKSGNRFDPDAILVEIKKTIFFSEEGKVSYRGLEHLEARAALQFMIRFPEVVHGANKESLLTNAISDVARNKGISEINKNNVIIALNNRINDYLSKKVEKYHCLTSLSLGEPFPFKTNTIDGSTIRLLQGEYPKKYFSRSKFIKERTPHLGNTAKDYTKIIISVNAQWPELAIEKSLKAMDLQRAIWCLCLNSDMEIFGDAWAPINKIRLGEVHTLHKNNGEVFPECLWYEPNFVQCHRICKIENIKISQRNFVQVIEKIEEAKFSNKLKESLIRYVRALDEKDHNVSIIKLWSAVENLLIPQNEKTDYDLLIQRCSFIFKDYDYHRQILESIREYRNQNVHAGLRIETAKSYSYLLQFYFKRLISFCLSNLKELQSLEEIHEFLDLPYQKEKLQKNKSMIEKAIHFRA